jgi:gluconate 2-dehydrogenase alpha chain
MFNVQLLLHSKIGAPYDPVANTGVVGRNFTHQTISSVNGFFDNKKFNFNPFISSGAIGMCIDEFNGDNFDHGPHGFVGGGYMGQVQTNGRPIQSTSVPPGTPKWGAAWKSAVRDNYLSTVRPGTGIHGSFYSYRDVYLDLDPTYKDRFGRPLMRLTIDFHDNELKQNAFLTDKFAEIIRAMGAHTVEKQYRKGPYDSTDYQTTHLNGGAIMGADPSTSAINRYLQSWDVPNLFVMGASAFPQNAGYNPTGTVAALAFWSAAAIRGQYLKNPGPLVHA